MMSIKRGDIVLVDFTKQANDFIILGKRPAVVVSNNTANCKSPIISVIPMTSQNKKPMPTHIIIRGYGLSKSSTVLAEQVQSVNRANIIKKIGTLANTEDMQKIDCCLRIQLGVA
jgi:mRNA interferase MazF